MDLCLDLYYKQDPPQNRLRNQYFLDKQILNAKDYCMFKICNIISIIKNRRPDNSVKS